MPSESESLARELCDDLTAEQYEEQEENLMMCQAEEEAHLEAIDLQNKNKPLQEGIHNKIVNLNIDSIDLDDIFLSNFSSAVGVAISMDSLVCR